MDQSARRSDAMDITNNFYYDWPLVTLIGNSHEPQWVEDTLVRVNGLDHDMLVVLTGYMIIVARDEAGRN